MKTDPVRYAVVFATAGSHDPSFKRSTQASTWLIGLASPSRPDLVPQLSSLLSENAGSHRGAGWPDSREEGNRPEMSETWSDSDLDDAFPSTPTTYALQYASEAMQADREVVLAAVTTNGRELQYASDELRADKEVVLAAMKQEACALEYASDTLRADREFVLAAVTEDGCALTFASDELRADKRVVLAAMKTCGCALVSLSKALRTDREVVLAAVANAGYALQYASDELRADKEVVLAAVKENEDALHYASKKLRADVEVVLAAITTNGRPLHKRSLQYATDEFGEDDEVVLAAVKQYGWALWHAEELREDPFLRRLAHEVVALDGLPRLYGFILKRHRQEKAARVAAQVDQWLIDHECDPFTQSLKRQHLDPVHTTGDCFTFATASLSRL